MCIVTYENINCLIYTSTLTIKQHLNDVFLKVDKNNKKMNEPKWMTSKINHLQRYSTYTLDNETQSFQQFHQQSKSHIEMP